MKFVYSLGEFSLSYVYMTDSNLWPNGIMPTFRDRKRVKYEIKMWSKLPKNKILLELLKRLENMDVGQTYVLFYDINNESSLRNFRKLR